MILHNEDLSFELRKAFNSATKRIWIAVPFIGSWVNVERLTGLSWITKPNIDVRLITDIRNENFISTDTYDVFNVCAQIRTLSGLHAKVYIIDDFMLLTSANLTGTAFSKRYEIGIKLVADNQVLDVFNEWWNKAKIVDHSWSPTHAPAHGEPEDFGTSGLPKLWDLPKKSTTQKSITGYALYIHAYNDFVKLYEANTSRLIPALSIYQEVDAFFNYLFHEHPNKPSHKYLVADYRKLTDAQKTTELKKYLKDYQKWVINNPNFENYRIDSINVIQSKLDKRQILNLQVGDIQDIAKRLHCMNSLALNKFKFLNPKNNSVDKVKTEWNNLLHNNIIDIGERIETCRTNLYSFGISSVRELISWYAPDKYPVVNGNSNSGMKFFGYDIKTY